MNAKSHNIHMVEIVAAGLRDLLSEMVFVGGATTSLYLPDKETQSDSSVRPTNDVDCVVEMTSRSDYNKFEKKLRALGFKNSMQQGAPLCRWLFSGVTVDIMPTDPKIIGFANRWYKAGMASAILYRLPSKREIRIFSIPYFLASKIEAFKDRGKEDFFGSRDFEDIITLIDGRDDIRKGLTGTQSDVKQYLHEQFQTWSTNENFLQSLVAHLAHDRRNADGARRILDIVRSL